MKIAKRIEDSKQIRKQKKNSDSVLSRIKDPTKRL